MKEKNRLVQKRGQVKWEQRKMPLDLATWKPIVTLVRVFLVGI